MASQRTFREGAHEMKNTTEEKNKALLLEARNPDLRPRAPSALPPAGGAFLAIRPHGGGWRCGDRGAPCPGGVAECERADPGGRRLDAGCRALRQRDGGGDVTGSGALRHRDE